MCVDADSKELTAVTNTARRGRVYGWKLLTLAGRSAVKRGSGRFSSPGYPGQRYHPGYNEALLCNDPLPDVYGPSQYRGTCAGLHIFRGKQANSHGLKCIRVSVAVKDLIVADAGEFAARRLYIAPAAWAAAKLPERKTGKRMNGPTCPADGGS